MRKNKTGIIRINGVDTWIKEVEFVKSHTELIEKNKHRPKFVKPYIDRLEIGRAHV